MKYGVNYKVKVDYSRPYMFETWVNMSRFLELLIEGAEGEINISVEAVPKHTEKKDILRQLDDLDDDMEAIDEEDE